MIRLYCIGFSILIVAIITNYFMSKLDILSWYDFFNELNSNGIHAFHKVKLIEYLWLLIGYPFTLGLGYLLGKKIYKSIFC